jgi:hypothetical protein
MEKPVSGYNGDGITPVSFPLTGPGTPVSRDRQLVRIGLILRDLPWNRASIHLTEMGQTVNQGETVVQ